MESKEQKTRMKTPRTCDENYIFYLWNELKVASHKGNKKVFPLIRDFM